MTGPAGAPGSTPGADRRVRVACFGNVANALFQVTRTLRDAAGVDAHLYVGRHEPTINRPDRFDSGLLAGYPPWIHEGDWVTPASVIAPFDYTMMIWVFVLGYWMFGEVPTVYVYVGSAIVVMSGLFVIWRERQLRLRRERESEGPANVI